MPHRFAFRTDLFPEKGATFHRNKQISQCAETLEFLRTKYKDEWSRLATLEGDRSEGLQELKKLVKHLIRIADESNDHANTVSFVSKNALIKLERLRVAHKKQKALSSHLYDRELAHEHMVPGDYIFRVITDPRSDGELAPTLEALCCRALITKGEVREYLDKNYKSTLPTTVTFGATTIQLHRIEPKFYGLARYKAVNMLDELQAVNHHGKQLLAEFKNIRPKR